MRGFGELEAAVMQHLWDASEPLSVRDVLTLVNSGRRQPLAYTSVMTVLDNLHRKGATVRAMEGRAWVYEATRTRQDYSAELMREALAASQDLNGTLAAFVRQLTPEESTQLAQVWTRAKRRRPTGHASGSK